MITSQSGRAQQLGEQGAEDQATHVSQQLIKCTAGRLQETGTAGGSDQQPVNSLYSHVVHPEHALMLGAAASGHHIVQSA